MVSHASRFHCRHPIGRLNFLSLAFVLASLLSVTPPTSPTPSTPMSAAPRAASSLPHIVVVGGGIAGVTCCQELASTGAARVTLIAPGGLLKGAKNVVKLTRRLETFDGEDNRTSPYSRTKGCSSEGQPAFCA